MSAQMLHGPATRALPAAVPARRLALACVCTILILLPRALATERVAERTLQWKWDEVNKVKGSINRAVEALAAGGRSWHAVYIGEALS